MVQIIKNRIPGVPSMAYAGGKPTMVILHETANQTSTIENEASYVKRNWQNAFFHYIVDHTKAYEMSNPDYLAWGAGSEANPYAIHIELVRDNGNNFSQAYTNWLDLAVEVAKRYGIPIIYGARPGIVTHSWVSQNMGGTDHSDPDGWLVMNGVSLGKLKEDLDSRREGVRNMDKEDVLFLFRLGYNREATEPEYSYWVGKTHKELEKAIYFDKANHEFRFGAINYKPTLEALNKAKEEITQLKASAEYVPVDEPVFKKKAA